VIVVRSRGAAHTLFEPLNLSCNQQLRSGELGLVDPLGSRHRLGEAIDNQDVAGIARQVDAVVAVDKNDQAE